MIIYYKDEYNCMCAHEITYAGYNLDISLIDKKLCGSALEMYEAMTEQGCSSNILMFVSNDKANDIVKDLIFHGMCDITEYLNDTLFYPDFDDPDDIDLLERHGALERRSTISGMMEGK